MADRFDIALEKNPSKKRVEKEKRKPKETVTMVSGPHYLLKEVYKIITHEGIAIEGYFNGVCITEKDNGTAEVDLHLIMDNRDSILLINKNYKKNKMKQ